MSLLNKLFSRPQTKQFEPWERTPTAKIPRPWQDTRRYVANSNYLLPKDKEEELRLNFQHYALFNLYVYVSIAVSFAPAAGESDAGSDPTCGESSVGAVYARGTHDDLDAQ